jgi:hypothetical protein
MINFKRFVCAATLLAISGLSHASIYSVSLSDADGPEIRGSVDTQANTFTLSSWIDNGAPAAFWTPTVTNLVYTAVSANGNMFDVADDWDGTISNTWGFIANDSNNDILWNEGDYTEDQRFHGWGGAIGVGNRLFVDNSTEFTWRWAPTGSDTVTTITFDNVVVALVDNTPPRGVSAPALGILTLLAGTFLLGRQRAQKRA